MFTSDNNFPNSETGEVQLVVQLCVQQNDEPFPVHEKKLKLTFHFREVARSCSIIILNFPGYISHQQKHVPVPFQVQENIVKLKDIHNWCSHLHQAHNKKCLRCVYLNSCL